jgi:hypothetical protein
MRAATHTRPSSSSQSLTRYMKNSNPELGVGAIIV